MSALSNRYRVCQLIKICAVRSFSHKKVKALNKLLIDMSKDKKVTVELQKQRQKLKEKNMKYTPGSVTLQVLGSGAKGTPRALYVFTDQSRYLFNCGEGTQRLAHEHKMKLSKLEHIFITHHCWENIGGLPGVALTIQDVGVPEITIHGPKGTADIFMATKRFVVLKDLNVKFRNPSSGPFEDSVMQVHYISIVPLGKKTEPKNKNGEPDKHYIVDEEEDEEDYYAYETNGKTKTNPQMKRRKVPDMTERKRLRSNDQWVQVRGCSICYICRLHPRQGTLLLEKCVELGVPPGPLLGKLKSGQDVILANGVRVKASDVCSPPDPGPVFLVIDCPSADYIDALLSNKEICKYNQNSEEGDNVMAVVHFCSPEVLTDTRYLDWVASFPAATTHLSLGEGNFCTGSIAVHRLQYKLNLLHPKIFPILADSGIPSILGDRKDKIRKRTIYSNINECSSIENSQLDVPETALPQKYKYPEKCLIKACTFYNVHLRPRKGFDSLAALQMEHQEFVDETMAVDGFKELLQELRKKLESVQTSTNSYPKVLFLGTGSCIPNKTRNTSGILIEISEKSCMLLDCGEGTYGQLVRFFGKEKSDVVLNHLHVIFVSHLHADHHIGLISLLKQRRQLAVFQNSHSVDLSTLYLLAPRQIIFWLNFYNDHFEPILSQVKLVPCSEVIDHSIDPTSEHPLVAADMTATLGLKEVLTAPVCHCPNAFGVAISHEDGWKITYSGDTMPCKELVKLGEGSDLLIHEATMEDELVQEARAKRHSTTSEAIRVGREMNAQFTILTHFSQRYAKLPRMKGSINDNVGIAFDNMQVTLQDLKILPMMYPALKLMFADHCEEMDQKAIRRKLKLERGRINVN